MPRSISTRTFGYLVIALALATLAGMAILWPQGDSELELSEGLTAKTELAEVIGVETARCPGTRAGICNTAELEIKSRPEQGKVVPIALSSGGSEPKLSVGDEVRVAKFEAPAGLSPAPPPTYNVTDFERREPMLWLSLAFAALVIVFGRLRGALSLAGLGASLLVVLVFIVPAILRGTSPLAVAVVGAMAVMLVTIPLAHGIGPKSRAAICGTAVSLALVAVLAVLFTHLTHLTGLGSEETAAIQLNTASISLQGLLIAGMVIGALGVLDDVTISQASTVLALRSANPGLHFAELYSRAIEVGRDHVSATVNTLVLAYVGSSLPTLLIFGSGQLGFVQAVNLESVAAVIVATLVGSIGLICAVPITTALATMLAETESELGAEPGEAAPIGR